MAATTIERRTAGQATRGHRFTVCVLGSEHDLASDLAGDDCRAQIMEIVATGMSESEAERLCAIRNEALQAQEIRGRTAQMFVENPDGDPMWVGMTFTV